MHRNKTLRKIMALLLICFFLSSVQLSQALPLGQQDESPSDTSRDLTVDAIPEYLQSPASETDKEYIEEALASKAASPADVLGWLGLYHILMFINTGRECLETLDPVPCGEMVNHLMWALFIGILDG